MEPPQQTLIHPPLVDGLQALRTSTDWGGVGLVLAIVGSFLLANAILFRHPRSLVEEHFGGRRRRLTSIRDFIFHRVNIHLGFLFLLSGFGVQLYGHLRPEEAGPKEFPTAWVGVILLLAIALEVAGWWWSHRLFRRYVREYLLVHPADFETDAGLAREVGELFGIPATPEDTVESYVLRLRVRLGVPGPGRAPARGGREREEAERGRRSRQRSGAQAAGKGSAVPAGRSGFEPAGLEEVGEDDIP